MKRLSYRPQSIVLTLVFINVVVFLFTSMVRFPLPDSITGRIIASGNILLIQAINTYGLSITLFSLFPVMIKNSGWVWQFLTYMFMHGSLLHLFFNMYALYLFGKPLEERWGNINFLFFYLFTGVGAGVVTYFWNLWRNPYIPTVGASGAIFGVILAFGLEFPDTLLLLFFFIPVRARYAVFIFGGIEIAMILTGTMQRIGHFTHLAGILFGYIYYLIWIKKILRFRRSKKFPAIKGIGRFEIRRRKRILERSEEIIEKLLRGEKLRMKDEDLLNFLRESFLTSKTLCNSEDFIPDSELCLKCDDFYSCLYRYIIERSGRYLTR